MKIRSSLYKMARTLGDVESLTSPQKFVRRKVRKSVYRLFFRSIRKII
jgi:hypothetical protein